MFDLNKLTKKELLELNHRVVEQLKELDVQKTSGLMNDFSIGHQTPFISTLTTKNGSQFGSRSCA